MKTVVTGIFLAASVLSTQALAETEASTTSKESTTNISAPTAVTSSTKKWYIGADIFSSSNTFEFKSSSTPAEDFDNDSTGIKLKVGHVFSGGWIAQVYYQNETFDEKLYSSSTKLNEIGIDGIKTFNLDSKFTPFVQVGLGYGQVDLKEFKEDNASEYSLKLGGGVMYAFTPKFEGVAGIDLQRRDWSSVGVTIGSGTTVFDLEESSTRLYIGANYYF